MSTFPLHSLHIYADSEQLAKLDYNVRTELWIPAILCRDKNEFQIKLAYRGSHTRKFPKKSYQIKFISPKAYDGQKLIHLNAEYVDPSMIRNKLSLDFFRRIDVLSPHAMHVLLFINDECLGIYLQLESVDKQFLQKRNLVDGPIYYAINSNANFSLLNPKTSEVKDSLEAGYMRKHGTIKDDAYLRQFIYTINTASIETFEHEINKLLDVDNYLRWLAGAVCTQNFDGFIHNYALYRNRVLGRFIIIPWDYDATWGRNVNGNVQSPTSLPIEGFNTLTARILDVQAFRTAYSELLRDILQKHFTKEEIEPEINQLQQALLSVLHLEKSSDLDLFHDEKQYIVTFINKRRAFLIEKLGLFESGFSNME